MPPRNKSIKYFVDLESVAATIGAFEEASKVANSNRYISKLITAAHAKVSDEFDAHIIADAMASTAFNHMFEWGTAGINNGRTTRRLNPFSPEAKLWDHMLVGSGKNKGAAFRYLPSKVPVPKPTTEKTGISQRYLSKLKSKHIFWNKAAVMELGMPVVITPKSGGKLFIPLGKSAMPGNTRGFVMTTKSVKVVPGGKNIGSFNAYWEKFWNSVGEEGMQAHMQEGLNSHLEEVARRTSNIRSTPKPATPAAVTKAKKRGAQIAHATMISEATEREHRRIRE